MDRLYRLSSIMGLGSFVVVTLIILSNQGFAATETLELVPPVSGVIHLSTPVVPHRLLL